MTVELSIGAKVSVGGAELPDTISSYIEQLIVDDDLGRPAMFEITLLDPKRDIAGRAGLAKGAEVEIEVTRQGAHGDPSLVLGQVVTLEYDDDEVGVRVVVRGYAISHRLHRGRRTQVFSDATDSDIIKQVAETAGLDTGSIEATTEVHQHVSQANLSDWAFIKSRAEARGLDVVSENGELRLAKRSTAADAPSEFDTESPRHLVRGLNLEAFHGRISAAEQVGKIEVRGYDEARKVAVVGRADAGTTSVGIAGGTAPKVAGAFADAPAFIDVMGSVRTDREAEDAAKALAERIGSAFAEVEGTAHGNTALRAGVAVRVSGVSPEFSGAYVLSRARHVIDGSGYRTQFWVNGRHDRSMLGLVASGSTTTGNVRSQPGQRQGMFGVVRGLVGNIEDPEKLGRVTVKLPWLADEWSSNWAPVMQLGAGPASGTFFLPAVDDEVLVAFQHGDINMPIVLGGLFNAIDKPPEYGQFLDNGRVTGRSITSRKGHEINFLDGDDNSGLTIHVVSDSGLPVVSIGFNATDNKLVIQSEGNVEVQAEREIKLTANKITVQAQGDLVLKGGMVKIN